MAAAEPLTITNPTPTDRLKRRGLFLVSRRAQWQESPHKGRPAWLYPVFKPDGTTYQVMRVKYADDRDPRYLWEPAGAERPDYYMLPGTVEAIAQADGMVYLAAGDPDNLTLRAAGLPNTISWFGENNVPRSLVDDLSRWGVKAAMYFPDLDEPGMDAAGKVARLLAGSGIKFTIKRIPGARPVGFDLNALWIECRFDAAVFRESLSGAAHITEAVYRSGLARDRAVTPPRNSQASDNELDEVERRVRAEIAARLVKRPKGGPHAYECPFEDHGPHGKVFYFNPEPDSPIGGCQGKHDGLLTRWTDLAAHLDIDVRQIAADVAAERRVHTGERRNGHQAPPPEQGGDDPPEVDVPIVGVQSALETLAGTVTGKVVPRSRPFVNPYPPMRQFGGSAWVLPERGVGLVIGAPGMGKTAFCETHWDAGAAKGLDYFYWGPEWSPEGIAMRAIRRWGGPTVVEQQLHNLAILEEANNVPPEFREGRKLSREQMARFLAAASYLSKLPGRGYVIDTSKPGVSTMLEAVACQIHALRKAERHPAWLFFDYLQRAKAGTDWRAFEMVMETISAFAIENRIFVMVVSQVTKSEAQASTEGTLLSSKSAQGVSDQKVSWAVSLNPQIYDGQRQEQAVIVCTKNNLGGTGRIRVRTALNYHRFEPEVLTELRDDLPPDDPPPALPELDEPMEPAPLNLGSWSQDR